MTRSIPAATWTYRRAGIAGVVEFASWEGAGSPGLRPHFHDETQIVVVLSGSRAFRVNGEMVMVPAGHAAAIPAGLLHTPLATLDEQTVCLNAYVPAGHFSSSFRVLRIPPRWQGAGAMSPAHAVEIAADILSHANSRSVVMSENMKLGAALTQSCAPIGDIAASLGRSREGFTRLVTRRLGVSPHAFRVLARLNLARQLLRAGQPIAAVAADAGFSDQSHLTRLFRSTFGTTPGVYWRD
jgi:AraC-like DNA-binding protein/mannose-6-phosphate isomerase-like protein (cupin superfamily)